MALFDNQIDITRNIKIIEWLKSELLTDVANLFKGLVNGVHEEVSETLADTLANIILICYLLGKRLGINYRAVEKKIENKIRLGLVENHDVEKYYGDLSELAKHLDSSRVKKQGA
ncbi:MazG-like nucleotide pyrophosphohydrolase family protein [Ruminiclostridium sufflavum DSM 19573]|uniref:MazG-like nucleotide pyrophosphohydrolase family protein n=1 Tax=Ruminiclostridium sufflavum DSM 19573 TaxID=1121337 RepID=A0A318XNB1_9FIRM|nr:MazG-like family protein [Ruminiclostridium sufflavum]PYG89096.1 MazG-like nucleotide pyrophosphohydrolase family protein [Ruminiclostridium sufflavum DSM 19573]